MNKLTLFLLMGLIFIGSTLSCYAGTAGRSVKLKDLIRISSVRENSLIGYGIVTGLAGTGDTARSVATVRSISNVLANFGLKIDSNKIRGRNVAAVMIVATLSPFAKTGDKLDVNISSMGDARSLLGGTLLRTHLKGADELVYALAQGPLSVGGYKYDLNGNVIQKNHPTAAYISGGALVEKSVVTELIDSEGYIEYSLFEPDFTTISRVANAINKTWVGVGAIAIDASAIRINVPLNERSNLVGFISKLENLRIEPDNVGRVVINERTGTVVAGGDVQISSISITHGDLNLSINTKFGVSQPIFVRSVGDQVRTEVVPTTSIKINEENSLNVTMHGQSTITELVAALNQVKATSRDIITILQSIKRAGALHAELIIQ